MASETAPDEPAASRRRFLALCGSVSALGGLSLLSGCEDDVVGSESVPSPTSTATATPVAPPNYTANDNDRLNFMLQVHYLLAAYLQRALSGDTIPTTLTSGGGAAGTVSGGRAVAFIDAVLAASMREVLGDVVKRIGFLRRTLGASVQAQPAINIAGGQGGPFQAIAQLAPAPGAAAPTTFFDPYASENDFLLGAVALSTVATSVTNQLASEMGEAARGVTARFAGGVASSDSIIRNALFVRADVSAATPVTGQVGLFDRANIMSDGRDQYDGTRDLDQGLGGGNADFLEANIIISDGNWVALRRTPEQALGIFYASAASVTAGAFFPTGVNGVIKQSGSNVG